MDDLIKRQDAIAVLSILADKMDSTGKTVMEQAVEVIRDLRSAQKTGHWIYKNGAMVSPWYSSYECSECGCLSGYFKYCPECGSRNRGDEE